MIKAPLWKYDIDLGIAFFCQNCKKFICVSGKCECGTEVDLNVKAVEYKGRVRF